MSIRLIKFVLTVLLLQLAAISISEAQVKNAIPTISSYYELLVSGNFESAGFLWTQAAQERSARLGINYDGVPVKADASSPIVQDLSFMRDYLQPPVKSYEDHQDGAYQKLLYSAVIEGKKVEHTYYAKYDGSNYWLTYPQDIYAKDWQIIETDYFRIHINPQVQKYINAVNLKEADKFVERIADSLELSTYDTRHLQSVKIEYFYCNSDRTVETITGRRTKGLYDKASSDIISSFFPHYHEVVHLLTDYKLRNRPLFTHPLFEEGLAVYLGGRWGKSTASLAPLGIYLYKEGITPIDSLLSYSSFRANAESDLAYPLAGIFTRFLIERIGQMRYRDLYRKMSGDFKAVSNVSVDTVKAVIQRALNIDNWDKFAEIFGKYIQILQSDHLPGQPGTIKSSNQLIKTNGIKVTETEDWLIFEFDSAKTGSSKGSLFFGHSKDLNEAVSAMYIEHFPDSDDMGGYRYAVRFDSNEAGLYDYATNYLLGKFINGLTPSPEYYDEENHKIAFRFKKSLTNGVFPADDDYKYISE
jgi:hypothetical protein